MSVRPILRWPDRRLRSPAEPVSEVTDTVRAHWQDMIDTMEAMPGVGLAAPQIGVGLRLAVVDASAERGQAVRMANPEIVHASVEMREHEEASPCLPGVSARLSRPRAVTVRFLDETGAETERDFVLLWATSVQHQIDHLDGRLFVDRLSRTRAVTVRFLDETGAETERDFVLLWATSVQHQIDHLDGRLFVDRLSRTKRDMLVRRSRKAAR